MRYLLFILLLLSLSHALVVINSMDGRDVLSGVYYAAITNQPVYFVPPSPNLAVFLAKVGTDKDIFLIESKDHPIITGLKEELEKGHNRVEVYHSLNPLKTNIELAERSGAQAFVVVDSVYGYNALSVLPYAKLKKMYLLFSNASNAERVANFLKEQQPLEVLVYGYVDEEVVEALNSEGLVYDRIDNNDKYLDNMEIVDRYFSLNPSKRQVILADGNAIDDTMAQGNDPILFISQVVPDSVYEFLKQKVRQGQIRVALLVDKEYLPVVGALKDRINEELGGKKLSVILKVGLAVPSYPDQIFPVEFFPLPGPILGLNITSITYNPNEHTLDVVYENTGNVREYVKSTIKVFVDGRYYATVGDEVPFELKREETLGKSYKVRIDEGNISVNITSLFGLTPESLDHGIKVGMNVGRLLFIDRSNLTIKDIYHDVEGNLYITFYNVGEVPLYFKPYAVRYGEEGPVKVEGEVEYLEPAEGKVVRLPKVFEGKPLTVGALYGAREGFLSKKVEQRYEPTTEWWLWLLLIIALFILIFIIWRSRKKKGRKHGRPKGKR